MAYTAPQLTAIELANREAARRTNNISEAFGVMQAATALHAALERSGGLYSTTASYRLLDLCSAIIGITDGGDAEAMRDSLMFELACDEYGNPVPEDSDLVSWPNDARTLANGSVAR